MIVPITKHFLRFPKVVIDSLHKLLQILWAIHREELVKRNQSSMFGEMPFLIRIAEALLAKVSAVCTARQMANHEYFLMVMGAQKF